MTQDLNLQSLRQRIEANKHFGHASFTISNDELSALLDRLERAESARDALREALEATKATDELRAKFNFGDSPAGAAVPDTHVVVPKEPTEAMRVDMARAYELALDNGYSNRIAADHAYIAALHATPAAPSAPTEQPAVQADHFYTFNRPAGWINLTNPRQSWEEWTREQGAPTTRGWKVHGRAPAEPAPVAQASQQPVAIPTVGRSKEFEAAAKSLHMNWTPAGVHRLIAAADAWYVQHAPVAAPLQQAEGWISVDERLPEHDQMVAVIFPAWGDYERGRVVTQATYYHGQFVNDEGDETWPPSHWSPLPQPPAQSQPAGPAKGGITNDNEGRAIAASGNQEDAK